MLRHRFLPLGLPLLAGVILVPVPADAPTGPTGNAPLEVLVTKAHAPTGLAVAPDGTLFFTDRNEGRLWQRGPTGRRTKLLDRLEQPRGLVRGADGTLSLVADGFRESKKGPHQKGVLLQWQPDGGTVAVLAEGFITPQQPALDKDGHLLLSTIGGRRQPPDRDEDDERDDEDDTGDTDDDEEEDAEPPPKGFRGTVFRIHSETGDVLAAQAGFRRPAGVVGDAAGTLTVAAERFTREKSHLNGSLFQIDPHGNVTRFVHERFTGPAGLVRDALGVLFLAVQRDREHPKEDGLILKVAPDGSLTRFAHGFERPWGLTFDPQGNLYVTDPRAGTISRFLASAAPTLAAIPETTTEAKIAVSGTAEPAARITVRGGQEDVTTQADLEGKFTLDVPLVPDQVNQLKVYATGAQGDGLTSAPASTTIHQQTTPPPPSISIVLQITNPAPGATITSDSVLVRGLVDAGGLEVGVTVNAGPAAIVGNSFSALVPVTAETTEIAAMATTTTGATASARIPLTVQPATGPTITLDAFPPGGAPPLTVTFHLGNNTGRPLVLFELDADGDGRVDITGSTFDEPEATYSTSGYRIPILRATDDQGQVYTATTLVTVGGTPALEAKWEGMKDALRRGDIPGAMSFVHTASRERYEALFRLLTPGQRAAIDQYLATALPVEIGHNGAEYEMRRSSEGEILSSPIWFQVDEDGIWRIRAF